MSAAIAQIKPRKLPTQGRAKVTVEAILQAATRIFIEQGYRHMNTNLVANMAGVSIGSLYQYFPNKDALLYLIYQKHCDKMQRLLSKHVESNINIFNKEAIYQLIKVIFDAHLVESKLHICFAELKSHNPHFFDIDNNSSVSISNVLKSKLLLNQKNLNIVDLDMTVYIIQHSLHSLVHTVIARTYPNSYIQSMISELTCMIYGYINTRNI